MQAPEAPAGTVPDLAALADLARRLRRDIIEMTTRAGSGHPTSSLSAIDVMTVLYFGGFLRHNPRDPRWPDRDRFILSKGHAAPALYAVLAAAGYFPREWLWTLRQIGSPLEGHPNMRRLPGVEASTGSLGQGLSIGLGHALAARLDGRDYRVYVLLGDGECDEGQVWEAAMAARHYRVGNLVAIVDHNKAQQSGLIATVMDHTPLAEKWAAFGWRVHEIDGHDLAAIASALAAVREERERPSAIIAHTVKGKGVSFLEKDWTFHGKALTPEQARRALEELGWS